MVKQDILVMTRDSGWWKSSEFLVIGQLTNLILVINTPLNSPFTKHSFMGKMHMDICIITLWPALVIKQPICLLNNISYHVHHHHHLVSSWSICWPIVLMAASLIPRATSLSASFLLQTLKILSETFLTAQQAEKRYFEISPICHHVKIPIVSEWALWLIISGLDINTCPLATSGKMP